MGQYRLLAATAAVGLLAGWAVYGTFMKRVVAVTPWHGGTPFTNLATVLRVWMHYLWLLVWPAYLSADYGYRAFPVSTTLLDARALAAALLLAALAALAEELAAYPAPAGARHDARAAAEPAVCVPLQLAMPGGTLSFISTTTVFGTPVDITLSELALETFFPADAATAQALRRLGDGQTAAPAA
jgi:hypothetical protein